MRFLCSRRWVIRWSAPRPQVSFAIVSRPILFPGQGVIAFYLPDLQLVRIASSVNVSQHSGSLSAFFVNTGGTLGTRPRGSTGSSTVSSSSSPSAVEICELDLNLEIVVPCVSARWRPVTRDEMEPRWRTEVCIRVRIGFQARAYSPELTALGVCSIPTLKSHKHNLQSSPTLPKR